MPKQTARPQREIEIDRWLTVRLVEDKALALDEHVAAQDIGQVILAAPVWVGVDGGASPEL